MSVCVLTKILEITIASLTFSSQMLKFRYWVTQKDKLEEKVHEDFKGKTHESSG